MDKQKEKLKDEINLNYNLVLKINLINIDLNTVNIY